MLGARDRAPLRVAYDTAYRRSELAAMRIEDIEGPNGDGAGIIEIGWSKTDQVYENQRRTGSDPRLHSTRPRHSCLIFSKAACYRISRSERTERPICFWRSFQTEGLLSS